MHKIVVVFTLLIMVQCTHVSGTEVTGRQRIFQLYQEGLFYETDMGDLNNARQRYQTVAEQQAYQDLAVAALFRLALIYEKTGEHDAAKQLLKKIQSHPIKQGALIKQVESKLKDYADQERKKQQELKPLLEPIKVIQPKPTPIPTSTPVKIKPISNKIGLGLTTHDFYHLAFLLRYLMTEEFALETQINLFDQDYSGRGYYRLASLYSGITLFPYIGIEFGNNTIGDHHTGYRAGIFVGAELVRDEVVGLNFDGGLYTEKFNQQDRLSSSAYGEINLVVILYF